MLTELHVENLLLIERAELRLGPGLNVLTGETGAGKTVLAHALDLLLGGRPRGGIVRPGAAEAWVEGSFALTPELRDLVGERLPADADDLVLARRVSAEGRTRAYVGGRSATAADLQAIGAAVLSFYGQHEHRRLTLASSQLDILDGFCGPEQVERRRAFAAAHAAERLLQRRMEELRERAGARERELDLLVWELEEIEQADPSEAEEERLVAERERLRHLEGLQAASAAALEAMAPDGDGEGAVAGLAAAARALDGVRGIDAPLDALGERLQAIGVEADDLAAELRHYAESVRGEGDEGGGSPTVASQLDHVEERLSRLERLKRKHGGTIGAVLAHADECRRRRSELEGAEEALAGVEEEIESARSRLAHQASELRAARVAAATRLEAAVCERLGALAMPGATFRAALSERSVFGPTGGDEVDFLIAPNPGVPAGPLRDTASGGELSRIMLALMSVAAEAGPATLVFDEIDAGIGGQTARAVGDQLRDLSRGRQILCITHLPQIASLADRHFTIVKDASGETARTTVTALDRHDVVGELVRMLGADDGDRAARRHAQELLRAA
ncbi:MAG: DNA repair protein RecN [uncultured Solirubrobacteraceae bacterium]|uniref:DNA repair protein RecN n=1 Tax=uncultured Solirubrobacteraceae bacterium TaxID=1162706 RepID=A0A6J4SY49_9ACTN|nr:MAG: DNA repair protein RecN [uncultured Solirubrobacteraceae bacterium]